MESRPLDAHYDSTNHFGGGRAQPAVLAAASTPAAVSGTQRFAHHHHFRPRQPHMNVIPPEVLLAPRAVDPNAPQTNRTGVVDQAVQTVYRDSEAQTNPYTPEVTINPDKPLPEVLMLEGMTFMAGLPAGLTEVKMVELARRRRAAEGALPPTTDEASVTLRLKLLEEMENGEAAAREADIDAFQEERLSALAQALAERDRANTFNAEVRVDLKRQELVAKRDKGLSEVAKKRLKTMRKLDTARAKALPPKLMKLHDGSNKHGNRDVLSKIAAASSSAYAPARREGAPMDGDPNRNAIESVMFAPSDPEGLRSLASNAPLKLRRAKIPQPRLMPELPAKTPAARADKRMKDSLELATNLLERASLGGEAGGVAGRGGLLGIGGGSESEDKPELPAWFSKPKADRPPTPRVEDVVGDPSALAREASAQCVRLLQRLLRGRAAQNAMYVGRAARQELIDELRVAEEEGAERLAQHAATANAALDTMAGGGVANLLEESAALGAQKNE